MIKDLSTQENRIDILTLENQKFKDDYKVKIEDDFKINEQLF